MELTGLKNRRKQFEEEFFAKQNRKLVEQLREKAERQERREALCAALSLTNDQLIDALIDLGVCPETVTGLTLVPMVLVAWADGKVQKAEREAIHKAAAEKGVEKDDTTHQLLENWLTDKPGPELMETWKNYIGALVGQMTPELAKKTRDRILGRAREVAEAAGSFLGLTSGISAEEQKVIDELASAFD